MNQHTRRHIERLGRCIAEGRGTLGGSYLLFTGAGASNESGLPLATRVRDAYLRLWYGPDRTPAAAASQFDVEYGVTGTFDSVAATLRHHLGDAQRRDVIQPLFADATPSLGYHTLRDLAVASYVSRDLYTTNWDPLLEQIPPNAKAVTASATTEAMREVEHFVWKLHGDFSQPSTMVWLQEALPGWLGDALRTHIRRYRVMFGA